VQLFGGVNPISLLERKMIKNLDVTLSESRRIRRREHKREVQQKKYLHSYNAAAAAAATAAGSRTFKEPRDEIPHHTSIHYFSFSSRIHEVGS
jgi:hypothetical protein